MPSRSLRARLSNKVVLLVLLLEAVALGVWSELFRESPLAAPLVEPVMTVILQFSGFVTGCVSLACGPYVIVGVAIYLYGLAVTLATLYRWFLRQEAIPVS
ncbi:hypothetical protein [Halorubellus litoreus]|uniref:Uncharacterized protein n=1 Tax=Halorubellus litoreus TaxID=755308 RepID=A0ABD5VL68_9EURY